MFRKRIRLSLIFVIISISVFLILFPYYICMYNMRTHETQLNTLLIIINSVCYAKMRIFTSAHVQPPTTVYVPPSRIHRLCLDGRRVVSGSAHRVEWPLVRMAAVQRAVVVHFAEQRALVVMMVPVIVGQRLMATTEINVTVVRRRRRRRVTGS